jgi:hypothetical protein
MMNLNRCERKHRELGFSARLECELCGRGPCSFGIGEPLRTERVDIDPVGDLMFSIPNRLAGVRINAEGCAI